MQKLQSFAQNLILIRHAQSNFNRGFLDFIQKNKIENISWQACLQMPGFNQAVSYAQKYIDSPLTAQGLKQCQRARDQLKDVEIDLVLVSPYQRALETCRQIFKQRNVKIQVHPLLSEVFRFACDVGHHMEQKKKQFNHFDFSHMQDSEELWFIEHLAPHHQETWTETVQKEQPLTYQDKERKLLHMLKEKTIYESEQELRQRIWKIKQLLSKLSKTHKKIAVVSHYHIVGMLLAQQFTEDSEIVNPKIIQNAQPVYTSLDYLLQFK